MSVPFHSRIYLTGFMGSGKSTIGRGLAAIMNRQFIDSDEEIKKREGKSIQEIFAEKGEEVFRKLESETLKDIAGRDGHYVVALGGGTICTQQNLQLVLTSGYLVYIQLPVAVLVSRLAPEKDKRPLLSNLSSEELPDFIEKKLKERESFYEQAHLMVNGINLGAPLLYEIIRAGVPQGHK